MLGLGSFGVKQDNAQSCAQPNVLGLDGLISSIGSPCFHDELFKYLNGTVGADYCTVFHFREMTPEVVASMGEKGSGQASSQSQSYVNGGHWRDDPAYAEMQEAIPSCQASLTRLDVKQLPQGALHNLYRRGNIRDKILICAGSLEDALGISVLRSVGKGPFSQNQVRDMEWLASTLLAIAMMCDLIYQYCLPSLQ